MNKSIIKIVSKNVFLKEDFIALKLNHKNKLHWSCFVNRGLDVVGGCSLQHLVVGKKTIFFGGGGGKNNLRIMCIMDAGV